MAAVLVTRQGRSGVGELFGSRAARLQTRGGCCYMLSLSCIYLCCLYDIAFYWLLVTFMCRSLDLFCFRDKSSVYCAQLLRLVNILCSLLSSHAFHRIKITKRKLCVHTWNVSLQLLSSNQKITEGNANQYHSLPASVNPSPLLFPLSPALTAAASPGSRAPAPGRGGAAAKPDDGSAGQGRG